MQLTSTQFASEMMIAGAVGWVTRGVRDKIMYPIVRRQVLRKSLTGTVIDHPAPGHRQHEFMPDGCAPQSCLAGIGGGEVCGKPMEDIAHTDHSPCRKCGRVKYDGAYCICGAL